MHASFLPAFFAFLPKEDGSRRFPALPSFGPEDFLRENDRMQAKDDSPTGKIAFLPVLCRQKGGRRRRQFSWRQFATS